MGRVTAMPNAHEPAVPCGACADTTHFTPLSRYFFREVAMITEKAAPNAQVLD
jgi:hypothetical protein